MPAPATDMLTGVGLPHVRNSLIDSLEVEHDQLLFAAFLVEHGCLLASMIGMTLRPPRHLSISA